MSEKIQVRTIRVDPFETGAPEFVVDSFKEANAALGQLSIYAPKGGCYHKCDFTINFEDGNTYNGRYDLKHYTEELPDLQAHVRDFIRFSSGMDHPDHMTEEAWTEYLEATEKYSPGLRQNFIEFAEKYNVGVEVQ